jgi:hypothetical protein
VAASGGVGGLGAAPWRFWVQRQVVQLDSMLRPACSHEGVALERARQPPMLRTPPPHPRALVPLQVVRQGQARLAEAAAGADTVQRRRHARGAGARQARVHPLAAQLGRVEPLLPGGAWHARQVCRTACASAVLRC